MKYNDLIDKIFQLQEEGLEIFSIGKSVLGKEIYATHIGEYSGHQILIQAAIHAREYITTLLLIEQARHLHNNNLVNKGGIFFIFLTNPDGTQIVLDGIDSIRCDIQKQYLTLANNNSSNFSQFKANINLVDLNTNFNADWGNGINNIFCPSVENFIGFYPESEREVQNLIKTTLKNKPLLTISYHSKGNIIFYGFNNQPSANIERDKKIGEILSESCGYPLIFTENSTGGYKDWCVDKLKIPAYTFEVGDESLIHPITEEYLPEIYQRNKNIPLLALNLTNEYANQIDFNDVIVQNNKKEISNETNENSFRTRIKSLLERRNSGWRSDCKKQ